MRSYALDAKIDATERFIKRKKRRISELTQNELALETKEPDETRTKKQCFSELTRQANELDAKCTQLEEEHRKTQIIATFMQTICNENTRLTQELQAAREREATGSTPMELSSSSIRPFR